MRIIVAAAIALFCFAAPVQALSLVNADMIRDAQRYGQRFYKQETDTFLLPWTVFEEKALRISEYTERAYFYSPYLLIALHAKDSMLQETLPQLTDSERILTDYNGFLIFELILYSTATDLSNGLEASLTQEKRTVNHAQIVTPAAPEAVQGLEGETMYRTQCYLYFADRGISYMKPVRLVVRAGDKRERCFKFNLIKMR